jgi:hypothetical protein
MITLRVFTLPDAVLSVFVAVPLNPHSHPGCLHIHRHYPISQIRKSRHGSHTRFYLQLKFLTSQITAGTHSKAVMVTGKREVYTQRQL